MVDSLTNEQEQVLLDGLKSPQPVVVLYSLNTLATVAAVSSDVINSNATGGDARSRLALLLPLLNHPSEDVRFYVVQQVEQSDITATPSFITSSVLSQLQHRLAKESVGQVRGALYRALVAMA